MHLFDILPAISFGGTDFSARKLVNLVARLAQTAGWPKKMQRNIDALSR